MLTVELVEIKGDLAAELCRVITANLPEYFGIEESNEQYYAGVKTCTNFAVKLASNYIGLISINFLYPNNANIYWLGVIKDYQKQGIGKKLIQVATDFVLNKNAQTITVETLAATENDQNYLKKLMIFTKLLVLCHYLI